MSSFRSGHSARRDWRRACDECLALAGPRDPPAPAGGGEPLGFVYVTDQFGPSLGGIVAYLRERTGVGSWVGSVAPGVCACGQEYFGGAGIALLLADLPAGSFRVFDTVSTTGFEAFDQSHRRWCAQHSPAFAVVHGDPRNDQLLPLIEGLCEKLGPGYLVGGLSSAETAVVQLADRPTAGGISGVLLSPDVAVSTRVTQGCSPIGPRREITRCEGNIIATLDGRPALEVFKEDIGEILARDLRRAAGYIFVGLPIAGSDTGDYLVRNLIGVDPRTQIVAVAEPVERGGKVLFCRRDASTALRDLRRMLGEIAASIDGRPRAGVYFSCLARGPNLFGPDSEELNVIRESLGEFPLAGMFANGEISHNRLYAYTGVLTVFL